MIRVLIADDEPLSRRGLEQLLAHHADCTIVAACRNGPETVRALDRGGVDVAFLDINMPGLNGFEVLNVARAVPAVVFVTAYDQFAVEAFEARALDYLLKPVRQHRFEDALQRVREKLVRRAGPRLVVPTSRGELVLDLEQIDWIEAQNYCAVVHAAGRRYASRESLKSLERRIDHRCFVRVHRSSIVRVDMIRAVEQAAVVLRHGKRLPLSRRRRERVAAVVRGEPFPAPG